MLWTLYTNKLGSQNCIFTRNLLWRSPEAISFKMITTVFKFVFDFAIYSLYSDRQKLSFVIGDFPHIFKYKFLLLASFPSRKHPLTGRQFNALGGARVYLWKAYAKAHHSEWIVKVVILLKPLELNRTTEILSQLTCWIEIGWTCNSRFYIVTKWIKDEEITQTPSFCKNRFTVPANENAKNWYFGNPFQRSVW